MDSGRCTDKVFLRKCRTRRDTCQKCAMSICVSGGHDIKRIISLKGLIDLFPAIFRAVWEMPGVAPPCRL